MITLLRAMFLYHLNSQFLFPAISYLKNSNIPHIIEFLLFNFNFFHKMDNALQLSYIQLRWGFYGSNTTFEISKCHIPVNNHMHLFVKKSMIINLNSGYLLIKSNMNNI